MTRATCCCRPRTTNSARRFENPALAVRLAIDEGWLVPGQQILELGAGCLRNARYLQSALRTQVHVMETPETASRFVEEYERFQAAGGVLVNRPRSRSFDRAIVTFVLETLCPCTDSRAEVLTTLYRCLKPGGVLILSIRGWSDVVDNLNPRVTRYCKRSDGFVTSLHTFIRPYSRHEIGRLLEEHGFTGIEALQGHRLASPRKLHLIARRPDGRRPRQGPEVSREPRLELDLNALRGRPSQRSD